jgi:hypothetical protein
VTISLRQRSALKAAKGLLKEQPSSLKLYNAYAQVETKSGNKKSANKVIATALRMSQSLPPERQHDAILLRHAWVWGALEEEQYETAWQRLISVAESEGSTMLPMPNDIDKANAALVLKARRVSNNHVSMIELY